MTLPFDCCRCHDHNCELAENCQRYLDRNNGGERTPHAPTLKVEANTQCDEWIPDRK